MARDQIKWTRDTNTTWTTGPKRGFTATITVGVKPNPYSITISGGGGTTVHKTFAEAKNRFRKFLFDKPVDT